MGNHASASAHPSQRKGSSREGVFAGLGPVLAVGRLLITAAFCRNGLSEQIALFVANVS